MLTQHTLTAGFDERKASRFTLRRTRKLAVSLAALASLGALVAGAAPASAAARPTARSTASYAEEQVYDTISDSDSSTGYAALDAYIEYNGTDVYMDDPGALNPACLWAHNVTWCGYTGGGSSNLTVGLNIKDCFLFICATHGLRVVVNAKGQLVSYYSF
jgi:hypothetical protein